jgi:hypothetical protein
MIKDLAKKIIQIIFVPSTNQENWIKFKIKNRESIRSVWFSYSSFGFSKEVKHMIVNTAAAFSSSLRTVIYCKCTC